MPTIGWIAGTSCDAVEPVPTTATVLPVRSCWCSHREVWKLGPVEVVEARPVGVVGDVEEPDGGDQHVALGLLRRS